MLQSWLLTMDCGLGKSVTVESNAILTEREIESVSLFSLSLSSALIDEHRNRVRSLASSVETNSVCAMLLFISGIMDAYHAFYLFFRS